MGEYSNGSTYEKGLFALQKKMFNSTIVQLANPTMSQSSLTIDTLNHWHIGKLSNCPIDTSNSSIPAPFHW